ncbi:Gfo/Idh/MocA family protein [Jiella mangrovi]|uniref:Gfo/Idh/MocA family oxidoreductase n=1 Tax=Jiella mangrovi TaxID=2821407 RepID=A0ABS4BGD8_9HYPH|nr:Gfo/Idh/MocA family oxidoreductase [Jiella mangrovi]MBP0615813.1 Gfo/Idh/MocA family oxidoreductase [Jiella mangrovi]
MKIGVIGLGERIATLAKEFKAADSSIQFVAVSDPTQTRLRVLQQLGDSPQCYEDPTEMLAAHSFDILMIGSPNAMHLEHLRLALASDAPFIFAEKPVVVSIDETMELARLIARHDGRKRLMIGLVLRYSALYRGLRAAQAAGQIGEVMSIEASEHIAPFHGSFFMRDWRRSTQMSGGFMLEKCCHDIDLYQGAVGARAMRVASFGGRKKYLPERRPAREPAYLAAKLPRWGGINDAFSGAADIIDYQTAIVEYATGASLSFHTNLNVPDQFRRFAVIGVDGMAEGDFIRNTFRVTLSDNGEVVTDRAAIGSGSEHGHYGADAAMAADILAHVKGDLPDLPLDVVDALEAGVTAIAMDVARNEGRVVELADIWTRFDAALAGEPEDEAGASAA